MSHAAPTDAGEGQPDAAVQADGAAAEAPTKDAPGKSGLLVRLRRTPIELVILAVLAAVTRFVRLNNPGGIVFDEVLFRAWALSYKAGTFYYDVHPPLGKLLLAAGGAIFGVDGGTPTNTEPALGLRILPAFAGTLLIIVVYVLIRQLCGSRKVATLGAGLLLLDNALLVESRFTLMDSLLLLFGISAIVVALAARQRTGPAYWWLLAGSAALAGCAFAIKVSGLSVFGLIGLIWLADVIRERRPWRPVLGQAAVLALVPVILYVMVFAIHFALLPKSGGHYDDHMPAEFKVSLQGNPAYNPDAKLSFPEKFVLLNKAMQDGQLSLNNGSHPYASKWSSWPIMKRGVYVYFEQAADGKARYIYTLGNPAVWWGNLLGALIVVIGLIAAPRRFAPYKWPLIFLGVGWAANYLPFAFIDRPMFLYHYFFGLIFSTAFVCVGIGALTGWIKEEDGKPWSFPSRWSAGAYWAVLGVALLSFVYFAPLTYGLPLTNEGLEARMWLSTWR